MSLQTDYYTPSDLKVRVPTNEELSRESGGTNRSIIGIATGTHFLPGGVSRNKRYYPENHPQYGSVWGEQLKKPDFLERMNNNLIVGTIGHDSEITEKEFREGLVSHYTKNFRIEPTGDPKTPYKGYAETYILDTPAGRCLKTYLESGMALSVSSRADGDFLPHATYKVQDEGIEVPVLDKDKFRCSRFDWVLEPGFLNARPTLKEELDINDSVLNAMNESYQEYKKVVDITAHPSQVSELKLKENVMGNTNNLVKDVGVVIKVTDDNKLEVTPNSAPHTAQNTSLPAPRAATATSSVNKDSVNDTAFSAEKGNTLTEELMTTLLAQNNEYKAEIERLKEAVASDAKPDINDMTRDMLADQKGKMVPKDLDSNRQELVNAINEAKKFHEMVGTPKEIFETLESINTLFNTMGNPAQVYGIIQEVLAFHERYGSPGRIAQIMEHLYKFCEDVGTPDNVTKSLKYYEDFFNKVGTPNEIMANAKYITAFFAKHGEPNKIAESLAANAEYVKFFKECGTPDEIRANMLALKQMNEKISQFQELGLTNISEMKTVLQEIQDIKLKNYAHTIAENTGINSETILDHLKKGMSERQIVDLYNNSADNFYGRYLAVSENAQTPVGMKSLVAVGADGVKEPVDNVFMSGWNPLHENNNSSRLGRMLSRTKI